MEKLEKVFATNFKGYFETSRLESHPTIGYTCLTQSQRGQGIIISPLSDATNSGRESPSSRMKRMTAFIEIVDLYPPKTKWESAKSPVHLLLALKPTRKDSWISAPTQEIPRTGGRTKR